MLRKCFIIALLCLGKGGLGLLCAQTPQRTSLSLMGSAFSFTAIHESDTLAWEAIQAGIAEVQRIEALISSWNPSSQTSLVNRMAGKQPVKVEQELFNLIRRALKVAELTGGAFDPTFAAIDQVWAFDGSMTALPTAEAVARSVEKIDYKKVILKQEDTTVYLSESGMKIGFGAIGKGYAANRAKQIMRGMGIHSGLVNAGGDLIAWGTKGQEQDWQIGIADPQNHEQIVAWLNINGLAVVTSGDYERFVMIDGLRYGHIIDPRTGYPAKGLSSVSILCPDAELADALATAVFVMGREKGLPLINQLRGIEALLITDEGEILKSKQLQLQEQSSEKGVEATIGGKN
ncbi:MAG: FAD:protein FMN transferase [Bacteroidota bacterium]